MCSEAQYIAVTIKQLIEEFPVSEDCYPLQRLYRKTGYTAPEACGALWMNIYDLVSRYNDDKIHWHVKMYNIYHNRLAQYKRLYVSDKN